jgi:hypothetical protein
VSNSDKIIKFFERHELNIPISIEVIESTQRKLQALAFSSKFFETLQEFYTHSQNMKENDVFPNLFHDTKPNS